MANHVRIDPPPAETRPVQQVPVALIVEPSTSACGCASPRLEWSGVYGRSPRRVYFVCHACDKAGAFLFPAENHGAELRRDGESFQDAIDPLQRLLWAVHQDGEPGARAYTYVRLAEDVIGRRTSVADVHIASFQSEVAETMVRGLVQRVERLEREAQQREAQRHAEHRAIMEKLERRVTARRARIDRRLAKRPAPTSTAFPLLICGAELARPVIYGLIDPREPERVRYVGKASKPAARLAQHVGAAAPGGCARDRWMAALLAEDVVPDMVCLERVPSGADIDARERYWILTLRDMGQSDLNTSIPRRVEP